MLGIRLGRRKKIDKTERIVLDLLENGPMPVEALLLNCDAEGIGDRTIRRADYKLGIISHQKTA